MRTSNSKGKSASQPEKAEGNPAWHRVDLEAIKANLEIQKSVSYARP